MHANHGRDKQQRALHPAGQGPAAAAPAVPRAVPPATILPASSAAAEEGATPSNPRVTGYQQDRPNPFLPMRHPVTGKWHDPVYSLRRQAELVKLAREHGVEELLPPTPKGTEERLRRRVEFGLRVKGTGVGQQVKGHAHERQMVAKYVSPQGGGEQTPAAYLYERNEANGWTFAQDGEEERSHAQHAEAHQGMEAGKSWNQGLSPAIARWLTPLILTGWKEELDQIPQVMRERLGGWINGLRCCTYIIYHTLYQQCVPQFEYRFLNMTWPFSVSSPRK